MTTMTRLIIDIPARTPVKKLHEWAQDINCGLYRRSDGTFLARPSNPTQPPQPPQRVS